MSSHLWLSSIPEHFIAIHSLLAHFLLGLILLLSGSFRLQLAFYNRNDVQFQSWVCQARRTYGAKNAHQQTHTHTHFSILLLAFTKNWQVVGFVPSRSEGSGRG